MLASILVGSVTPLLLVLLVLATLTTLVLLVPNRLRPAGRGTIPGLPRLPILGSLPWIGGTIPPHLLFTQLGHRYGPLFELYLGPHRTVVVNSHVHAREVLLQRGRDFAGRPSMVTTDLLTRGGKDIAFADYSLLWKLHRRLVHNSLALFGEGSGRLQEIVMSEVESLCKILLSYGGCGFDPSAAVNTAITNVVCTLVFSTTYRHGDAELQEVIRYNDGIVRTIARGGLVDIFSWMKVFPSSSLRELQACVAMRDRLLVRKLQEHKAALNDGEPRDLLDALLKGQSSPGPEGEAITDDHVLMTAAEAFGAGVETTSTTLLWILSYLLHHPEVQERVQKELDEQVGGERPVCVADRGRLPYLDSVINEGMRIRPVSPVLIPHSAMKESRYGKRLCTCTCQSYHLVLATALVGTPSAMGLACWSTCGPSIMTHTAGTDRTCSIQVTLLIIAPKYTQSFPDRFLDNQGRRVTPSCFLPFGAGPRICVGESLARLELFLFLSSILQRMSFMLPDGASPPNLQGRLGVVLQPLPYKVVVRPRGGWEVCSHAN
ncbi:steroid 17-alpha-hydroxylase/17,20 lyase isoform X2 [Dunckerocampus dactyliophorus]|uniref:steroid 17-alpha-hydroxylase/17,20 lyase isoform X2 n=1 Tax=Dunckerocampus dactyliophorus TaxID=161453 RepID=UPI0024049A55|nr:steroid 17-alpha-hydroxylase/17,20 lyase isoform X2 [Dunckerocampus dactyliophorus]